MSDAADPRSPRSARHDPGRAVHELLGAAAGLRAAHRACCSPTGRCSRGARLRRLLPARRGGGPAQRVASSGARCCKGAARPMVLELPSYKMPSLTNAAAHRERSGAARSCKTAGTVIMAICIVMWWLSAYPRVGAAAGSAWPCATQAAAHGDRRAAAALADAGRPPRGARRAGEQLRRPDRPQRFSRCSRRSATTGSSRSACSPASSPARCSSRRCRCCWRRRPQRADLARPRRDRSGSAPPRRDDGRPLFTPATAASLLVFFVLAMQCLSTLAVTRRETGSWSGPASSSPT